MVALSPFYEKVENCSFGNNGNQSNTFGASMISSQSSDDELRFENTSRHGAPAVRFHWLPQQNHGSTRGRA